MKRVIKASRVEEFMRYHEDPENYYKNPNGFDAMYDILSQYGSDDEDVDVVFNRATPEDQDRMIALIKTSGNKFGTKDYCRDLYYNALECNIADANYCKGVVDAIEALFAGGWLDEKEFRTDL